MSTKALITPERLREVLDYDPETGVFTWRVRLNPRSKMDRPVGMKGGYQKKYLLASVDGRKYLLHRLAWLYMTGTWPAGECDHRDLNPANNKWENLRESTRGENGCNRGTQKNNTSGQKGVSWHKHTGKWRASIKVDGRSIHLGVFQTFDAAANAYRVACSASHGEFARHQ